MSNTLFCPCPCPSTSSVRSPRSAVDTSRPGALYYLYILVARRNEEHSCSGPEVDSQTHFSLWQNVATSEAVVWASSQSLVLFVLYFLIQIIGQIWIVFSWIKSLIFCIIYGYLFVALLKFIYFFIYVMIMTETINKLISSNTLKYGAQRLLKIICNLFLGASGIRTCMLEKASRV